MKRLHRKKYNRLGVKVSSNVSYVIFETINVINRIETIWSGINNEVIISGATSIMERLLVPTIPQIMTEFELTYKRIFFTTFHGGQVLSIFDYPIHWHTLVEVNMLCDGCIRQFSIWNEYCNISSPDGISNNKLLMVFVY